MRRGRARGRGRGAAGRRRRRCPPAVGRRRRLTGCLDRLAGQRGGLLAVAVGGRAGGQHEQPGAGRAGHRDAHRAVGVEADQVPPALRRGGEVGQVGRDPAVGARARRRRAARGRTASASCAISGATERSVFNDGSFVCRLRLSDSGCEIGVSDNTRKDSSTACSGQHEHGLAAHLACWHARHHTVITDALSNPEAGRGQRVERACHLGGVEAARACPGRPRRRRPGRAGRRSAAPWPARVTGPSSPAVARSSRRRSAPDSACGDLRVGLEEGVEGLGDVRGPAVRRGEHGAARVVDAGEDEQAVGAGVVGGLDVGVEAVADDQRVPARRCG